MKNIKIRLVVATVLTIIIATLLLAMTVSIGGGDSSWKELWNGGPSISYGSSGYRYGFLVSDVTAADYNNIYCIENGGMLESKKTVSWWSGYSNLYNVRAVVTITGSPEGTGTVKYYEDDGFWFGSEEGVDER